MENNCIDETRHVIVLGKFEKNKRYKEQIVQEIKVAICAMLNSNGGKVVIDFETDSNEIPVGGSPSSQMALVIRILEQSMISIIGLHQTISNIDFREDNESIIILVKKVDSPITINYNLYLPSQTQVVQVSPLESKEKVKGDIINRKVILEPVQTGSHCQTFHRDSICRICESKTVQLKQLKAQATKRTTLADRIIGKGNKFTCYVSAFANYSGGHIYYGIRDNRLVIGELIEIEQDKKEITKKVEKAIKKMIWPEPIGQPKRGEHWDIFFEQVVDKDNKPIPSTFVIVIFIAACLGGVFTEEPECYEMVKGKVTRMSMATWKERMVLPGRSSSGEEIPPSIKRIKWSSPGARKSFVFGVETLRKLISNGHSDAVLKIEQDKKEITKKVEKAIKKIICPEPIVQPKQGEHWDIFFEPVVGEDNKPIPSTFVIVIYIAAECYEMVKGKVTRMSLEEIPPSIQRIKWSSPKTRELLVVEGEKLRKLISNGHWHAVLKKCEILRKTSPSCAMLLLILSKEITASYRRGQYTKAHNLLEEYGKILPQTQDRFIFEVLKLYLEAAVKRASGTSFEELLSAALFRAEHIEPGLVTATIYVFATTVVDVLCSEELGEVFTPAYLSRRALEHLRYVPDSCEVRTAMEQRVHMALVTFHLGYNMTGKRIRDGINASNLDKVKPSLSILCDSTYLESPRTKYREVQSNLVLSIYNYRRSQIVIPGEKVRYLRNAFSYAEKSGRLARELKFVEMVEWSETHKAACVEALVRNKFKNE